MQTKKSNYSAVRLAARYARRRYRIEGRNCDPTGQYIAAVVAYYTALCDAGLVETE